MYWDPMDIPLDAFPATQRDAITTASALGFEYIWLDSLCIIQDSDEDFAGQVDELIDIYAGATVVISATSTESSTGGMRHEVSSKGLRIGSWRSESGQLLDIYAGTPRGVLDLEDKFLSSRAWVFQERLVSTATLHYTDEGLVWECIRGVQVSHDQSLTGLPWKADWRAFNQQADSMSTDVPVTGRPQKTPNDMWYEWINGYSERNLYSVTDKLPAIAGVTKRFAEVSGFCFVAGLWKEHFLSGLIWHRHNRTPTLIRYRDQYVAPTWSWASVQGRLEHRNVQLHESKDKDKGPSLRVLEYNVVEPGTLLDGRRTYQQVCPGATITVQGVIQEVVLDLHHRPGLRKRAFQECGVSRGFLNYVNVVCVLDEYDTSVAFKDTPRFYRCSCLRVASYTAGDREADVFLLLDREEGEEVYHRVGFAETDLYQSIKMPSWSSGVFEYARQPSILRIR